MTSVPRPPRLAARDRRRHFGRLYQQHFGLVWSVVRHLGVRDAQAEDVLQEVWLRVFRRLHTLDPDASTKAWLCSIARNVVLHHHRSGYRRRRKLEVFASEPEPAGDDPQRRHAARSTVAHILAGMDEEQRTVLVLSQVHGLSGPEIAEGLGIPLNTAYSRLRLARRHVRNAAAASEAEVTAAEQPPRRVMQRSWALLLPKLGTSAPVAATAGSLSIAKVGVPATVLAAATLGLVAVVARAPDASPPRINAPVASRDDVETDHAPQVAPTAVAAVVQSRPPEAAASENAPTSESPIARRAPPVPRPSTQASLEPQPPPPPAPLQRPSNPSDGSGRVVESRLAEETSLIAQAQQLLSEGDARGALSAVRKHREAFPKGQLVDAREGVWVRALCQSGRSAEARARASKLIARRPGSAVAEAVADACRE